MLEPASYVKDLVHTIRFYDDLIQLYAATDTLIGMSFSLSTRDVRYIEKCLLSIIQYPDTPVQAEAAARALTFIQTAISDDVH